jgi:hypothetical protein
LNNMTWVENIVSGDYKNYYKENYSNRWKKLYQ